MTSIHIVLGAPNNSALKPLMKNEGIVIGVDKGALIALNEGIKVDVALGDFDSISEDEMVEIKKHVPKVLGFPTDKDDTDTELALLYVLDNYPTADVYLYNWYGGRIDHLYSILLLAIQKRFEKITANLYYVSEKNNISYFLPGQHTVQKVEGMDYLSYISLTEVKDLILENVKYPLESSTFEQPIALISNEFIEEEAYFSFKEGIVAVVQSTD